MAPGPPGEREGGDGTWGLLVIERLQNGTSGFLVSERVGMAPGPPGE